MSSRYEIILSLNSHQKNTNNNYTESPFYPRHTGSCENKQTKQNINQTNKKPSKDAGEDGGWARTPFHCFWECKPVQPL